jgi:hypothetical protein
MEIYARDQRVALFAAVQDIVVCIHIEGSQRLEQA